MTPISRPKSPILNAHKSGEILLASPPRLVAFKGEMGF
jgi:hypothetical protein